MHFSVVRFAPSLLYCTAEIFRVIFGWEILKVKKKGSFGLVFVMREQLSGLVFNRGRGVSLSLIGAERTAKKSFFRVLALIWCAQYTNHLYPRWFVPFLVQSYNVSHASIHATQVMKLATQCSFLEILEFFG